MIYISLDPFLSRCRYVEPRTRPASPRIIMAANADIQGTLGLDQKAAAPPSRSLDKSESDSGEDADAIRERILAERLQTSNPPVLPIMALFRKKDHKQLDETATQPSVYDDPSIAQFFKPTAQYENLHRFDPEARWTWREELVSEHLDANRESRADHYILATHQQDRLEDYALGLHCLLRSGPGQRQSEPSQH